MGRDVAERAVVSIRSATQGTKELETVISFEAKSSNPSTPVKTMTKKRRAIGFSSGVPDFSATMTVVNERVDPEVNWRALMLSKERFGLTYERNGDGVRMSCLDVVVNDIQEPYGTDGHQPMTVEVMYLDEKEE